MAKYVTFPLNNVDYRAEDMQLWHSTRGSGVFSADGELETAFKSGMTVTISTGRAWIGFEALKGVIFGNMESVDLIVDMADGLLDRKDYVVIKHDIIKNETYLYIKKGELSNEAQPPMLERDPNTSYELAIAEINILRGTVELSQGLIADKRLDENLCGIMKDGVTSIPTATLQSQWESWFETVKNTLSNDVVGNLLVLINKNSTDLVETNTKVMSNSEVIEELETSTTKKSEWTQSAEAGKNWRRTPDGFIEQWGISTFNGDTTITYPVPFTTLTNPLPLVLMTLQTTNPSVGILSQTPSTLTGVHLYSNTGTTLQVQWYAKGK